MTQKPIIQICFSLKKGLTRDELKSKLTKLKSELDSLYPDTGYELRSCHLSRKLCIEKCYDTSVPDLFEEIFGDNYVCELTEDTFDEAMANIHKHREELSKKAKKLVLLSNEEITNVALELKLFTQNQVLVI